MVDDTIRKKPRLVIDAQSTSSRYSDFSRVGEGTYGLVFQAIDRQTRKKVAIKKFKATKEGEGISLTAYREIMLLREIDHENIVRMKDLAINPDDKSLSVVLDYAEYDLSEIIRFHKVKQFPPSPYMVKSLIWQVINGINYLHSNWICHRDLKPSNILVMGDGNDQAGVIKIADFGLARIFQSPLRPLYENGVVVTIWYRAPELLLGSKHYTKAVDMWAIGCIFAELITTNPLFPGREKDQKNPNLFQDIQLDKIFRVLGKPNENMWNDLKFLPDWKRQNPEKWKNTLLEEHWMTYPDSSILGSIQGVSQNKLAYDLLCKMIDYDPNKRITASAALDHPYFKEEPLPGMNAVTQPGQRFPYPPRAQMRKEIK